MTTSLEDIRACEYFYLHSISEPEENSLRVIVFEGRVGGPPTARQLTENPYLPAGVRAITHEPGCVVFELVWESYIGYSVENESYALPEPKDSVGERRLLSVYTASGYLDYLSKATWASSDYPGPFKHWALCCLNHVVNVVSVDEPVIRISTRLYADPVPCL